MNKESNVFYKITAYMDKEGREIEELSPLTGGDPTFAVILWLPIPSGPESFTMIRSRLPMKDVKNIGDAFNKHDETKAKLEKRIEDNMKQVELVVPTPQQSKIILDK